MTTLDNKVGLELTQAGDAPSPSLSDLPFIWLRRAGASALVWLGLPLLLYGWTVTRPFVLDDLHLVLKAERYQRGEQPRLGLYEFAATDAEWQSLRDRGVLPWWTPPQGRFAFFRPLSERLFYLDVLLFGRNPLGYRLMSMAWFALALILLRRLFQTAGGDPARAGVATFLFGISQAVTAPATFICNRNDLLVIVGLAAAAECYWRTMDRPRPRLVLVAGLAFVFALLAKESALPFIAVMVAHEFWLRRRGDAAVGRDLRLRIAGLLVFLTIAYVVYYAVALPWNVQRVGAADDLTSRLGHGIQSLGLLLTVWTAGFPVSALLMTPESWQTVIVALAIVGLILAAVFGRYLLRGLTMTRGGVFFGLWTLSFLLLALMAEVESRSLCVATVGWAYLLTCIVIPDDRHPPRVPKWARHWLLTVNGLFSIIFATALVVIGTTEEVDAQARLQRCLDGLPRPLQRGDLLVVAEAEHLKDYFFAADRLEFVSGVSDVSIVFLTEPGVAARVERADDHTLLIRKTAEPLLASPMHRIAFGEMNRPRTGQRFELRDYEVEVLDADGEGVGGLRFRFSRSMDDPALHFHPAALARRARSDEPALSGAL